MPDYLAEAVARIRAADREAEASQLAHATGNFLPYSQRKLDAAVERMEARYAELEADAAGRNGGAVRGVDGAADGDDGSGA